MASAKTTQAAALSAALVLPLLYVVPVLLNFKVAKTKDARQNVAVQLAIVVVALAALAAAVAAFGTFKRAPLAAVLAMLVAPLFAMGTLLYNLAGSMATIPKATRALSMYLLPLAVGTTVGASVAAGSSIAAAFGAPAWARTLAAVGVPAAFLPLALRMDRSNPYYAATMKMSAWRRTTKPVATSAPTSTSMP